MKEVERTTIAAALQGSATLAARALALHPLVPSVAVADRILDAYRAQEPNLARCSPDAFAGGGRPRGRDPYNGRPVSAPFVHLHCHSEYSILDGACRIKELVKRAGELEMPAVTVTDHGSMAGAVELYRHATEAGVKPIVGCEVYLVDDRFQKEAPRRALVGAPDAAGRGHGRLPQPRQARHDRLPRGLPLQAARRLRPAAAVLRRADRAHRLPVGPRLQGAARRRPAAGPRRARPARADLRPRPGLHRDPGRRHRGAPPGQPGPAAAGRRDRPAHRRHRRRPLPARRGRRPARGAALHPDRATSSSNPKRFRFENKRVLLQDARRDGPRLRAVRPRAAAAHARDRRALQRPDRARHDPAAALRRAGRRGRVRVPTRLCEAGLAERYGAVTPELQQPARSSSCRPSARWASPTTS